MALNDCKITGYAASVKTLSDRPSADGISAAQLRAIFDARTDSEVMTQHNALIAALVALGAESLLQSADAAKWKYLRVNADGVIELSADGTVWAATASSGHIIVDSAGNAVTQRARMKFLNTTITDDGTQTVVQGIQGPQGLKGDTGAQGVQGAQGEQGPKGAAWYPSVDALGNLSFVLSDSATPPAVSNIRGPQGPQGVQGAQGATGPKGDTGVQGPQGVQGVQGPQGATGPQGAAGAQGAQGPTGPQGLRGADGADGASFAVKALYATLLALQTAHPTGAAGDAYAVGTVADNTVYIWSVDAGAWTDVGALQGPTGPQGPQGAQGATGPKGDTGAQGPQGVQGIQGPQGATGPQGDQGIQGPQGTAGTSAYTAAAAAGYAGTESAFNAALADVPNKASKKVPAASGNLAGLDASGNLIDSGKKPADFAAAAHADRHAKGAADQVTPAAIGAAAASHSHSGYEQALYFSAVSVAASAFVSDATYTNWPYRAPVALTGVTADMVPDVMLAPDDAAGGVLAPVAACYAGGVYLYANAVPTAALTIPTVECRKAVS